MFCTKCGAEVRVGDRFCTECGAMVTKEISQSQINTESKEMDPNPNSTEGTNDSEKPQQVINSEDSAHPVHIESLSMTNEDTILSLAELEKELFAEADSHGNTCDTAPSNRDTKIYQGFYAKKREDEAEHSSYYFGRQGDEPLSIDDEDWLCHPAKMDEESEKPEAAEEPQETEVSEIIEEPQEIEKSEIIEEPQEIEKPEIIEEPQETEESEIIEKPQEEEEPQEANEPEPVSENIGVESQTSNTDEALSDSDEPKEVKKQKKKSSAVILKIIIVLLILLIVFQGTLIALCTLAPETKAGQKAMDITENIVNWMAEKTSLISGNSENPQQQHPETQEEQAYLESIVQSTCSQYTNISQITFDDSLIYKEGVKYNCQEIASSERFVDATFYKDSQGNEITYGQRIISTLGEHFNEWHTKNTNDNFTGISKLDFGEIRSDGDKFYILCRVTYKKTDNSELAKCYTVYARVNEQLINIDTIKEENI